MIIFGSGADDVRLGEAGTRSCPACRQDRPSSLVLRYSYVHLYFLFGMVSRRRFWVVCDTCGNGWKIPTEEVPDAKLLARNAIPFLRRWGCLLFLAIANTGFVLMWTFIIWSAERDLQQQQQQKKRRVQGVAPEVARIITRDNRRISCPSPQEPKNSRTPRL